MQKFSNYFIPLIMISGPLLTHIQNILVNFTDTNLVINKHSGLSGGSINSVYRLETNNCNFCLKVNSKTAYPRMFESEAKGLEVLRKSNSIHIPEAIEAGEFESNAYLLLHFVEGGMKKPEFWETFAESLAVLHQNTNDHFGLDHENYIGSLAQTNDLKSNWEEFFIEMRLEPMIKKAINDGQMGHQNIAKFESLFHKLEQLFPEEVPALLHGDLWSGNYMCNSDGKACIYDPAIYYGHREMDIGMTKLFGGFDRSFYEFYNRKFPLEKGWEERVDLCNLYPLLVHVNLFDGGYVNQVEMILKRFI